MPWSTFSLKATIPSWISGSAVVNNFNLSNPSTLHSFEGNSIVLVQQLQAHSIEKKEKLTEHKTHITPDSLHIAPRNTSPLIRHLNDDIFILGSISNNNFDWGVVCIDTMIFHCCTHGVFEKLQLHNVRTVG